MLSYLDDSSDKFQDHELLKCIKDVAYRARDLVEERIVDKQVESVMTDLICTLSKSKSPARRLPLRSLETVVESVFDGKKGIRGGLVHALQDVQSFKRKTTNTDEKCLTLQGSSIRKAPLGSNREDIVGGLLFTKKVGEVIMLLKMEGAPTLPEQLVEEILPLALPVGDFVRGPRQRTIRAKLEYTMATCYRGKLSNEVPELVE